MSLFSRIVVAPDRVEIADRGALILWTVAGILAVVFGVAAAFHGPWARGLDLGSGLLVGGFAFALLCLWLTRTAWLTRCRIEAGPRRILVERRNWRERQHRWLGFDDVAEVVLRERTDSDGDLLRGLHLVLRDGERVDLIATDQTDRGRFPPLADAIRAMLTRPTRPTPPPSPPRG